MVETEQFLSMLTHLISQIDDADEDGQNPFDRLEWLVRNAKPPTLQPAPLPLSIHPIARPSPWRTNAQDLNLLNALLSLAGYQIPLCKLLHLHNSLQAFTWHHQAPATLFGRLHARRGDYSVACCPPAAISTPHKTFLAAERQLNDLRFFAAWNDGPWTELPPISRKMVRESRKTAWLWTGDLHRSNLTAFSATEAHLLRCQLLRIVSACWLLPKGSAELSEEGRLTPTPAFKLAAEDAMAAENQLHRFPYLRREGSFSPLQTNAIDQLAKLVEDNDPPVPPLRPISEESVTAWRMRVCTLHPRHQKTPEPGTRSAVSWENLRWPGSATLIDHAQPYWAFFYAGCGFPEPPTTTPHAAPRPQHTPATHAPAQEPTPLPQESQPSTHEQT